MNKSEGNIIDTGGTVRSIDDQKIKHYYEQLYNEMLNGFMFCEILVNNNGVPENSRFLDINPAFERLTGVKKDNIIGKNVGEVLPWLKNYVISTYKNVIKNGKSEYAIEFFDEIDKFCEINAYSPVMGQLIMLFTDITKYRRAEKEKKDLQSQLIQSQKLEGIGRLAGGIAHDFNNLLTAILGYTDLALLQIENHNQLKDSLQQIRFATQRAAKLVHQLLIFSRKEPMEFKPHNLSDIIENLSNMLKRIIGEDIAISLELDPDLWIAKIDRTQIEQVIMNLAVNARDAMSKGGKLVIKTENIRIKKNYIKSFRYARPGKFVCLTIEDTGIGMSKQTLQNIFEPFYTTKKSGEGTGLGLSVVYGIIKKHQGWITVSSEIGKGSIFKIYLPA